MAENFSNMEKAFNTEISETYRVQNSHGPKRTSKGHITQKPTQEWNLIWLDKSN